MNIVTDFSAAKKEHWRSAKIHGSKTACNKKTSGVGVNDTDEFKYLIEKYPELCCKHCIDKYNLRFNQPTNYGNNINNRANC